MKGANNAVFLVLVVKICILWLNNGRTSNGDTMGLETSFSKIRDEYVRISVSKRCESEESLREALQIAVFNYLLAQKRFSDMKLLGFSEDSEDFKKAIIDFEEAVDDLRAEKRRWDLEGGMTTAELTYRNESSSGSAKFGWRNTGFCDLLRTYGSRNYDGHRGIDFKRHSAEDLGQVYNQPAPKTKLDRETIEKLDLDFSYDELPPKYIKMLEERKPCKQTQRTRAGRDSLLKYRTKGLSRSRTSNIGDDVHMRKMLIEDIITRKRGRSWRRKVPSPRNNSIIDSLEGVIESLGRREVTNIIDDFAEPRVLESGDFENKLKTVESEEDTNSEDTSQTRVHSYYNKQLPEDLENKYMPRGALGRVSMSPLDVALEIEKHIGGPLKHIAIEESALKSNKHLSELYERYLVILFKCLKLYDKGSSFSQLFICSRKQSSLMFALIQVLTELQIHYTFEKNDINTISSKISSIQKEDNSGDLDNEKINESEKILDFLLERNIFSKKPSVENDVHATLKGTEKKHGITFCVLDSNKKSATKLGKIPSIEKSDNDTAEKEPSEHFKFNMKRLGFTMEEYHSCRNMAFLVDDLLSMESSFINIYKNGNIPEPHLIYDYKIALERVMQEIVICKIKKDQANFSILCTL